MVGGRAGCGRMLLVAAAATACLPYCAASRAAWRSARPLPSALSLPLLLGVRVNALGRGGGCRAAQDCCPHALQVKYFDR
jgi:hypothetical protein